MSLTRIMLLSVLLMVMSGCQPSSAIPRLNNAVLWKRLGLNRAIGGDRPQITSSKKKGESTVYFIKLPPQPHYYIPLNLLPSSGSGGYQQKNTPDPFETVSVDFTANGKPENVYHWNLPLGVTMPTTTHSPLSTSSSTTTTTTTTTTTPQPPSSTRSPFNNKKPYRHSYYNNGKPHKLYFVKPSYGVPSTPNSTPISTTSTSTVSSNTIAEPAASPSSNARVANKKLQFKKNFYGNGKPNQLYFVQPSSHYSSHSV